MHVLTNAEKLIPLRDAASLAESRRLAGMRMVTGTTSPSTRYERISVSPASCSIKSEYVIASHAFKPQYKCINYIPTWEQRKLGEIVSIGAGAPPSAFSAGNFLYVKVDDLNESSHFQFDSAQRVDANTAVKPIRKGSIIFAKRGAAILGNKVRVLGKTAYIDTNMMALEPRGVDADFLWLFINQTGLYRIADTSTIPQINNKHIEPYPVDIPNMAEQQAIGTFFSRLDDLITLHQRKRQWLKWLDEGGEGTHHDIDILVFKFADDMKISVLCGVHACMTKSLGHTGNRYAGKQQQRGMGVP